MLASAARTVWVCVLSFLASGASFLAWEAGRARSGNLMQTVGGVDRVVSVREMLADAWSRLPEVLPAIAPYAMAFAAMGLGAHYLVAKGGDEDVGRAYAIAFGWIPGLLVALMGSDGLYISVAALHASLAVPFTVRRWPGGVPRVVELAAVAALSAVWFGFA